MNRNIIISLQTSHLFTQLSQNIITNGLGVYEKKEIIHIIPISKFDILLFLIFPQSLVSCLLSLVSERICPLIKFHFSFKFIVMNN